MIRFQDVAKRYGAVNALSGVSFETTSGEIFGYIGPNGAGKTTSLKILSGLITAFDGEVHVEDISVRGDRREAQQLIGYVPQDVGFQEWRTVDHALRTFAALSGIPKNVVSARVSKVLDIMMIDDLRNRRIVHLSGGNVQKLRIAQSLLHDPPVLVLDEPLSGLDPATRYEVKELLTRLKDDGKTILLSSHILSDIEDVADKIGILHEGVLVKTGSPATLRDEFRIGTAFELTTDNGEHAAASVGDLDCVKGVDVVDKAVVRFTVETGTTADSAAHRILSVLLAAKLPIRSFAAIEPSLEDVYISLTGGNRNGS